MNAAQAEPSIPRTDPVGTHTVRIPMRDGKTLAADLYFGPAPRPPRPAILIQTPYGKGQFRGVLGERVRNHGLFDTSREVFVVVDVRGFGESKDAGPFPSAEGRGRDGYDLVEWLAEQPWCNGRVGTWGPSALGRVQYYTAHQEPPHLVCCVPLVAGMGPMDYREYFDHGVLRKSFVDMVSVLGFKLDPRVAAAESPDADVFRTDAPFGPIDRLDVPILMISGWYDLSIEKHLESFAALRRQAGPVARAQSRLLVGPWEHMSVGLTRQGEWSFPAATGESDRAARAFFDYWLHDRRDNGWAATPPVRWMPVGDTRWYGGDAFDPAPVPTKTLYLKAGGELHPVAPAERTEVSVPFDPADPVPTLGGANLSRVTGSDIDAGPYDQRPIESRDDVQVFETPPLDASLMIHGSIVFRPVFAMNRPPDRGDKHPGVSSGAAAGAVSQNRGDASLAIRVCDVHPDGRSMLLVDGAISARFARAIERRSDGSPSAAVEAARSFEEGLVRGALQLAPIAARIDAGHAVRISISCTNYPRFALPGVPGGEGLYSTRILLGGPDATSIEIPWTPAD